MTDIDKQRIAAVKALKDLGYKFEMGQWSRQVPVLRKPDDALQDLIAAVGRLQSCMRSMGPNAEIAEIRLKADRTGGVRFEVEQALKASPSFLSSMPYPYNQGWAPGPSEPIIEVMGVRLVAPRE